MRKDAQDNREAIVATARELFSCASTGVSMRTIAKEAGVGVATLSRHFPERALLMQAVVDGVYRDLGEIVDKHIPQMEANPARGWYSAIHAIADLQLPALMEGLLSQEESEQTVAATLKKRHELERMYRRLMVPAHAAGLIPADLDPLRLHLALVMISRPLLLPKVAEELVPHQRSWVLDIFLDGLERQAKSGAGRFSARS